MKYKRSMIILIITIFLFSIASACASDANTTATAMVDEQTTEEVNEIEVNNPASDDSQILGSSASNEILKEGSITITNHTFEAIGSAIDAGYDIIYLEPGTYNGTDTIGIIQMENVKIIGNSTILDGQGMTEIFFIENSANIMMQDITFINSNFEDGGAVIATWSSNVQIIDCTFINNTASLMGGAIMLTLVDAEVINSTFTNNKAIADGGAIGWMGGNVKIEGCIFTNNTSEGSSIVGGQAATTANISTSIFTDNSAAAIVYECAGNYMTVNNNIFINNNGTAIDFENQDSNVDYNWFGHNQSNYKDEPGIKGCSKWLFLNATVNPTEISIDQNSIIAFKLDSYDNSSGDVDPFDASKLNLILDLTQTLGELDKTTALIGENITYTAKQGGNARITGKYETASYTIELNNVKLPTEISIANSTIALKANEEADAGATLNPDGAGNLTYTSNNSKVAIVENGKIKALANGTATITVSFEGNDEYDAAANKTIDVTVSLNDASVSVNNSTLDLSVGDNFTIVATTVPDDLNVTYVPDNAGVVSVDDNGVVTALKNGTATIVVKVGDGKVYAENSTSVTVNVTKIPTKIIVEHDTADLNVGDEFDPVVSLMPSNAGNLSFQSDDADVALVNGYGIITAVGEGEATITVSFSGNKKYAAAESKNITVTVSKVPTEISAEGCELFVDDNATISYVLIPEDAEGDVRFLSNDTGVVYA
ncbi:MAG: Ig-like domain-containing protein, partial [Methanobrevibacter sp.]